MGSTNEDLEISLAEEQEFNQICDVMRREPDVQVAINAWLRFAETCTDPEIKAEALDWATFLSGK